MANSKFPIALTKKFATQDLVQHMRGGAIGWPWDGGKFWYRQVVNYTDILTAATSLTLDLHTLNPNNLFPAAVYRMDVVLEKVTNFTGGSVSAITASVGYVASPAVFVTATSVFSGSAAHIRTSGATEFLSNYYASLVPAIRFVATDDDLDALTAGQAIVHIAFTPWVQYA